MIKINLIIILIISNLFEIAISSPVDGNYPAGGLYFGVSSNFLLSESEKFTQYIQNELLSMELPDQSGDSDGVQYSFTYFKLALNLQDFFYAQLGPGIFQMGWDTITFNLQWDYEICVKKVVKLCESGTITVYTASGQSVSLGTNLDVLFNTSNAKIEATTTVMPFEEGALVASVHCTDSVCLIPINDIVSEVSSQFVSQVNSAVTKAINDKAPSIEQMFTPTKQIPITMDSGNQYWIDLEGCLVEANYSSNSPSTITAAINGGIILENTDGSYIYPTQTPSYIPYDSQMESFTSDYCVTITGYFIESLLDAVLVPEFPMTIEPSQIPQSSPIQLNTSSDFFSGIAPNLTSTYPNVGIQVNLMSPIIPKVTINSSAIILTGFEISSTFLVLTDDNAIPVFNVLFIIDAEISSIVYTDGISVFSLNSTLISVTPNVTITDSTVGSIDASGFAQLIEMIQSIIKIPSITYPVPSKYSITNVKSQLGDQIIQLTFDLVENTSKISKNLKKSVKLN
ncbi:hypothetical protein RB653_008531 [Dictyostelium firmibasis]|uniref:Lipid-binding serum glycoprotein C-terminal domain-containing protein n=1 Tax=Dictyostelium firmibasis TaxID=79012 RepID=A0AAN7YU27_9MYCE